MSGSVPALPRRSFAALAAYRSGSMNDRVRRDTARSLTMAMTSAVSE
jgi:hypothetical protein